MKYFCKNCGTELFDDENACSYCGTWRSLDDMTLQNYKGGNEKMNSSGISNEQINNPQTVYIQPPLPEHPKTNNEQVINSAQSNDILQSLCESPKTNTETQIGSIIMGICATVLILAAITMFTIAVIPHMTDAVKVICMFALSIAVFGAGTLLHNKNSWFMILEGIGLLGLFTSLVVSHTVLHFFPFEIMITGLFCWMLLVGVYVYKREKFFNIIEQTGVCASFILVNYSLHSRVMAEYTDTEILSRIAFMGFVVCVLEVILTFVVLKHKKFSDALIVYIGSFVSYWVIFVLTLRYPLINKTYLYLCMLAVVLVQAQLNYKFNGYEKGKKAIYLVFHCILLFEAFVFGMMSSFYSYYDSSAYAKESLVVLFGLVLVILNLYEKKIGLIEKVTGDNNAIFRYVLSGMTILGMLGMASVGLNKDIMKYINAFVVILPQISINSGSIIKADKNADKKGLSLLVVGKYLLYLFYVLNITDCPNIVYSLGMLVIAALCIVLGIYVNVKSLRICGLVLSICSILKLVLHDITYDGLIIKSCVFFIAGIICLAISFLYSKFEKKLRDKEACTNA